MGVVEGSHIFSFEYENKYAVSISFPHSTVLGEANKKVHLFLGKMQIIKISSLVQQVF